jgi:Skp family chaperone for outer membrane proteins
MPSRNFEVALLTAALAIAGGPLATAQSTAPAEAAGLSPITGGPVVPGVCLLSQRDVFARSRVGVAANTRLRTLAQQAQDQLEGERTSIETDARTLAGQKATLAAADFQARQQALGQRAQAYQAHVQERSRQVDATRLKVAGQIAVAAQPLVADAYRSHGCGLLISRDTLMGGNMANDLTAAVVTGLDAKMSTISFDLEPPAPQPGATTR